MLFLLCLCTRFSMMQPDGHNNTTLHSRARLLSWYLCGWRHIDTFSSDPASVRLPFTLAYFVQFMG